MIDRGVTIPTLQIRKVVPCTIHSFPSSSIHSFPPSSLSLFTRAAHPSTQGSRSISAPEMHVGDRGREQVSPSTPGLLVSRCRGGSCSQTFGNHYKHPRLILFPPVRSLKQQIPRNFGCVPWQRETQRNDEESSLLSTPSTHGPLHFRVQSNGQQTQRGVGKS